MKVLRYLVLCECCDVRHRCEKKNAIMRIAPSKVVVFFVVWVRMLD